MRAANSQAIQAARAAGYRDGKKGRDRCRANYQTGEEWIAWFNGWKDGRADAEREIVTRIGVRPEFARCFYLLQRGVV